MTRPRVVIIAKAPVPGFAKTRLIPALGAAGAAALARRNANSTVIGCSPTRPRTPSVPKNLRVIIHSLRPRPA